MNITRIMQVIKADPFANVTFSGGDPIWCYTGFTFEALLKDEGRRALLEQLDVLVDGPFVRSLRDVGLRFRGSSNQRLIDVQTSLAKGKVSLWQG